ncbi:MAG TPA: hypothetical protein VK154_17200 [Chitinophagales bacterium]|nr:hypothetical protein [Chitinophagales bacterium]
MKRIAFVLTSTLFIAAVNLALQTSNTTMVKNGIKVSPAPATTDYPEAKIALKSPAGGSIIPEGKDSFIFFVNNYTLGAQTPDADQVMCANSTKGQHIHFIWDNAPYVASYSKELVQEVKPGHHVLLAFLSRSYHESLKHKSAYILKEFSTDKKAKDNFDEKAPHIFASRPKGEYIGEKEVKRVMLDFYLLNCTLSPKGYKVRATINGTEFILTKWQPYMIEGLALGANKIKLELLDKNNKPVNSPYNGTERTITLKTDPLK